MSEMTDRVDGAAQRTDGAAALPEGIPDPVSGAEPVMPGWPPQEEPGGGGVSGRQLAIIGFLGAILVGILRRTGRRQRPRVG